WGMTPPLSRAKPTQLDEALTNNLIRQLKRMDQYETERERNKRARFLALLTKLFRGFVTQIGIANKMPVALAQKAGGNIHAFGSYRLGVHGRASDIDALCVAPKFVTRDDFFTTFAEQLRARPECSELGSVPDAYVPVIKMVFDGIDVDITFAQLGRAQIPPDLDLADNNLL
ncbi:Nucleotidyltransferase, partial [Caulochytrium protostelioides]